MIQQAVTDKRKPAPARFWERLANPAAARLILALILLAGAYLRLSHVNWDMDTHIHPDERFLTMVSDQLRLPKSLGEYFDSTRSPLNPYNVKDANGNMQFPLYVYGNLPLTIVRVVAEGANKLNQAAHLWGSEGSEAPLDLTAYWGVHFVGRTVSGLFDLGGVLLIYLIARRLYGRRSGLLAALFLAFAVLPLQQAHFFTADTFATFFSLLTFYFCVRVAFGGHAASESDEDGAHQGGWLSHLAMGASLGATLACRINLAPLAGIALLAVGLRTWREWSWQNRQNLPGRQPGHLDREGAWLSVLAQATLFQVILFGLATILTFRVLMPYAFGGTTVLDFSLAPHWRDNMTDIQQLISGKQDYPPGHQWTGRTPFVFPFVNMVVWGMGLPLGIAGWAGFALAFWQIARGLLTRAYLDEARRHLLPVAWVGGMFLWQGLQFVQSMRYLLPLYPILGMLAAWLLWWLVVHAWDIWDGVRAGVLRVVRHGRATAVEAAQSLLPENLAYGLLIAVAIGTMLWGWGFLAIYRRPLTRVTASRWIYANVPPGSHIANEHWDDQLPLGIDGRCAYKPCGPYQGLSSSGDGLMDLYNEDTPEKRELLYRWLDEADYIVLSSNRLWASIPRLPTRYPMTSLYYKLLFQGQLGFRQVLKVNSFPTIFGVQFDDSWAEEAFSVYDHPVVYIFQKTPDYSEAKLRAIFGAVDLDNTVQMWPSQASKAPTALLMNDAEAARQRAGGTWTTIFNENNLANRLPVPVWLLLLELLGLIGFPFLFVALRGLSDRGYAFAKTFSILALAWLSWIGPSLKIVPYTRGVITAVLLLLAVGATLLAWRNRAAIGDFWRTRRSLLLTEEAIFLVLFALFLLIRWGNPDLWHPARGGEKPMDLAYLNAVIRSTTFPPYDPWFAGGFINYYYFGFVIVGSLIKLTGIVPAVAYNLAVPALFALTGLGAFGVAYNLAAGDRVVRWKGDPLADPASASTAPYLAGLAATIFVAIAGNLGEVKLIFDQWSQHSPVQQFESTIPGLVGLVRTLTGALAWLANSGPGQQAMQFPNDWWFWNASRIIPDTINEFPFFTFTYADLHAHMIALPLTLLALGVAVSLVRLPLVSVPSDTDPRTRILEPSPWQVPLSVLWHLLLLGLLIGALRATNTWDYPTYILVALAALAVLELSRRMGWQPWVRQAPEPSGGRPDRAERPVTSVTAPGPDWVARAAAHFEGSSTPRAYVSPASGAAEGLPAVAHVRGSEDAPSDGEEVVVETVDEPEPVTAHANGHGEATPEEADDWLSPWQAMLAFFTRGAVAVIWRLLIILAVAAVSWYPYTRTYATAYTGLQPWREATTGLSGYLVVHGFFLALIAIYLISELDVQVRTGVLADWLEGAVPLVLAVVVVVIGAGWILKAHVWLLAVPLLTLSLLLALGRDLPPARRLALVLMALGLAITMGVEVVRLQDDIGRMNTVFKFYLQAWVLFGVGTAFGMGRWTGRLAEWTPGWRKLAQTVALVLFAGAMLYPPLAARAKVADRFSAEDQPRGLDGMAYMDEAQYFDNSADMNLPADKAAIEWMLHNVSGSPVILEGNTPNYRWGSRFSIYTGLPAVMGWDWHERQQRSIVPAAMIDRRINQVHELYTTTDLARTQELLDRYHVKYIIVGQLERTYYGPLAGPKFDTLVQQGMLRVAYDQDGVRIYENVTG